MHRLTYRRALPLALTTGLALLGAVGCDGLVNLPNIPTPPDLTLLGPDGLPLTGATAGNTCEITSDCRAGLTCQDRSCLPAGTTQAGASCAINEECASGLVCDGVSMRCVAGGDVAEGGSCAGLSDCARGLRCELSGFSGVCVASPGTADLGQSCTSDTSCHAPLMCGSDSRCKLPVFGGATFMAGVECPRTDIEAGPFRVLFEVPPADRPLDDFYRLPFPNDIRLREPVGVDMRGYYTPVGALGGDLVEEWVAALDARLTGFSPVPVVTFRFSQPFEFGSVTASPGAGGPVSEPTLFFANITPDSPAYGSPPGRWGWQWRTGKGRFTCYNTVSVRPAEEAALRHGETYAVWITTDAISDQVVRAQQDDDFAAMLRPNPPADPRLQAAWATYGIYRDYLADRDIDSSSVAGAAVFTVQQRSRTPQALRNAVRAEAPPTLQDVTLCDGEAAGPCADGGTRRCLNASTGYLEVHARYTAPIFQRGTRPYLRASDGGDVVVQGESATRQGTESMCVSLAIPTGPMPDDGWPVVMYAHGTGGDFTSHLQAAVAGALTDIDLGGVADPTAFVVVGIDGVAHGPRRGGSTLDPDALFFNGVNPLAARGNVEQGAADFFTLTWLLENLSFDEQASPTGEAFAIDPDAIYFYGHSQGSQVGSLFAAHEPALRAAVLSGVGASLTQSLLSKTSPVNIRQAVQTVLSEDVSEYHPLLSLLQTWIDPVDSLHYAELIGRSPPADNTPRSLLQVWGQGDTYTPEATQVPFAARAGVTILGPRLVEVPNAPTSDGPISGNRGTGERPATVVLLQETTDGSYDGHFVAFRKATTTALIQRFFATDYQLGLPSMAR